MTVAHEKELKRVMKKSFEELQLLGKRKELEDVLNLRCPKCRSVFADFSACMALNCSCGAHFCALCQLDCGSDAHTHVANCDLNPNSSVFISMPEWQKIIEQQNRIKISKLWKNYTKEDQAKLSKDKGVRKLFQDLKIEMPGIQQYATQLAQLRGMGFCDEDDAFAALTETSGDVENAVELLL